jgi:hypothetical protein
MSDKVTFKMVTADNWEAVVKLELGVDKEDLVARNLYSDAEAQFGPDARLGARSLCREARRRLPDVRRAENEWQDEGSHFGDITSKHCMRDVIVAMEEVLVLPESFGFT